MIANMPRFIFNNRMRTLLSFFFCLLSFTLLSCYSEKGSQSKKLNSINTFNIRDFEINGLPTGEMTKQNLVKNLGVPLEISYPEYECGFLSNDEQSLKFESLHYAGILFTGSEPDSYTIEEIRFNQQTTWSVTYKKHWLSNRTTLKEFLEIFELHIELDNPKTEQRIEMSMLLPEGHDQTISDDLYFFTFNNGRLVSMEYWSPC
jgi:glutaredoxin-related protein